MGNFPDKGLEISPSRGNLDELVLVKNALGFIVNLPICTEDSHNEIIARKAKLNVPFSAPGGKQVAVDLQTKLQW